VSRPDEINILMVDDEPNNLVALEALLEAPGRTLVKAGSGHEALARIGESDFALVLLDIQMPVMDGYETARAIREVERARTTPIVFLTALDRNMVHVSRGYALGAVDFVFKPVSPEILKSKVAVFAELFRKTQQLKDQSAELERLHERSTALRAAVLEAVPDAILTIDENGRVLDVNEAAERNFGFSRSDFLHLTLPRLMAPGEASEATRRELSRVLHGSEGALMDEHREVPVVRSDGSVFPAEIALARVRTPGNPLFTVLVRDLSERKRLEDQLVRSQKMEAVGRLAGGIAHDFNNLLTVIIGYSEMVLGALKPGDPLHEESEEIRHSAERAQALTRQLLQFSRRQVTQPQDIDMTGVVVGMQRMLRRIIGEDIDMVTVLEPRLGRVRADNSQIEQVLANLVVNARDAMPGGGRVTIETSNVVLDAAAVARIPELRPGAYVLLRVTDTGHGMDEAVLSKVFEPYFTTKPPGKGTGLGLSTTYGIVRQSGGHIDVTSEPGKGARFSVYLPRLDAAAESAPAPGISSAPRGNETVLVVDDDAAVRRLTRNVLRATGYQVLEAENADAALGIVASHAGDVHLAVIELDLQEVPGHELAARVKESRPGVRLLFVAADSDLSASAGAPFLAKPFSPGALARRVRELLDEPKQ
jgi:two-component system cell cycle sensor histidine kinase/response regulator CckA